MMSLQVFLLLLLSQWAALFQASTQFPTSSVSPPVYALRLVGGGWPGEGRVEIYYRGSWGTVCDDDWDINDARVVCRQLGYPSAVSAPHRARFGQGSGRIWLDGVQCQGNESSIGICRHLPWGVHNCFHREDASVICSNYSIPLPSASSVSPTAASTQFPVSSVSLPVYGGVRLVGGSWSGEGRVEVYYRGSWGTVCDDLWDINDARVVCRQLGYPSAVSAPHRARFGQGNGTIWLDNVQCRGNESSIRNCWHSSWGAHNCGHHEDASVVCSNYSIPLPSASSVSPTAAMPTSWPSASTTPTSWPSPWTMATHRPSPTRPRFAFTISCFPSAMVAYIARDSLPLGLDASLLHLKDPSCGVNYVTKKSVIIKAPLKGCGTVRRNIGYRVSFHNNVVVPFGYGNKRSLSVFPLKCVYSHFGFP